MSDRKEVYKKIELPKGLLKYSEIYNGFIPFFTIQYAKFNEEKEIEKSLKFSMWDDFQFEAFPKDIEELEAETIDFEIEKNNPLYAILKRFLNNNKEFILDDDNTWGINNKIMKISDCKNNESIKVEFINNGEGQEEQWELDRYKIFIKNIIFDGRSKLDTSPRGSNNVKERLRNLFKDIRATFQGKEILESIILDNELRFIDDDNMIFYAIPELKEEIGFEHKHPHHIYDVWEHTKHAMRKSKPDLEIRLALLLHDIGKPFSYQEGEVRHFHGYAEKSEEMTDKILSRLEYSKEEIDRVKFLVKNHNTSIKDIDIKDETLAKKLLYIQYCDAYAHNPEYIDDKIKKIDEEYKYLEEMIKDKEERN